MSSLLIPHKPKAPNSTIEETHIKFGTFTNNFFNEQPPLETYTLDILIQTLEQLKQEITSFFTVFDSLFSISPEIDFAKELTSKFIECKLPAFSIRINFFFFYRKIDILIHSLKHEQLSPFESPDKETIITQFITEHNNTTYIDDIEKLKLEFLKCFITEIEMVNMIKSQPVNYFPSIAIYTLLTRLCIGIIRHIQSYMKELFNDKTKKDKKFQEDKLMEFLAMLYQFEICNQIFESYYLISKDSIWDVSEREDEWIRMKHHFQRIVPYSQDDVKNLLCKVAEVINLAYASFSKGYSENTNDILQKASSGFYMLVYFLDKSKAKTQSMKFLINPNTDISQTVWNILDSKAFRAAVKMVLPSIQFCKKFYLKRISPEITLHSICELDAQIRSNNFDIKMPEESKVLFEKGNITQEEIATLIKQKIPNKPDKQYYTKIKLYNIDNLNIPTSNLFKQCLSNCYDTQKRRKYDSLIIHIHGGGFVAMSPTSHENYTRKWVNKLEVPLVGIKYSLSPKHPFPKALDEVFQTYVWIITYMEEIFHIKINKIVIAGDSAGGNLALSLVFLLILKKIKLPHAIILAYPALKLSLKRMNLSYMNSLTDPILEYNLLKFCLVSYSGECNEFNQFLSPLFMDDKVMKLLPPVRIIVGSSDPLRDDSFLLLKRLVDLDVDVKLKEIKYFPHAFLNYDYPMMMPEADIGNEIIIEEIKKIIKDKPFECKQNSDVLETDQNCTLLNNTK